MTSQKVEYCNDANVTSIRFYSRESRFRGTSAEPWRRRTVIPPQPSEYSIFLKACLGRASGRLLSASLTIAIYLLYSRFSISLFRQVNQFSAKNGSDFLNTLSTRHSVHTNPTGLLEEILRYITRQIANSLHAIIRSENTMSNKTRLIKIKHVQ